MRPGLTGLPAPCGHASLGILRTHVGGDAPGVEIALPGSMASIEVRTGDGTHRLGQSIGMGGAETHEGRLNDATTSR